MKNYEIKKMIKSIIRDGSGMVYDDEGSGCAGPGFASPETLQEMLDAGDFDDAEKVPFDKNAARSAFKGICEFSEDADWVQIEFNFSELYSQIGWIWEV